MKDKREQGRLKAERIAFLLDEAKRGIPADDAYRNLETRTSNPPVRRRREPISSINEQTPSHTLPVRKVESVHLVREEDKQEAFGDNEIASMIVKDIILFAYLGQNDEEPLAGLRRVTEGLPTKEGQKLVTILMQTVGEDEVARRMLRGELTYGVELSVEGIRNAMIKQLTRFLDLPTNEHIVFVKGLQSRMQQLRENSRP